MTPAEHVATAEGMLTLADNEPASYPENRTFFVAYAQVHATLALAVAADDIAALLSAAHTLRPS